MNKKYSEYIKARKAKLQYDEETGKGVKTIKDIERIFERVFPAPSKLNKEWFMERASTKSERTGKLLSPSTLRYELGLAKRFLIWANMDTSVLPKASDLPKIQPSVSIEDIYTLEEYNKLLVALTNPRDKAMIQTLYESGMRAGELLSMTFENLTFPEDNYAEVIINGKTGSRRVPLIDCLPALRLWLNMHPVGKGAVWINRDNSPMEYPNLYVIVQRGLKRAKITGKKRIVHMFRHTRATHLRKEITDSKERKQLLGWKANSSMDAIYEHLDDSDSIDSYRKSRGQIPKDNGSFQKVIVPIECPSCETVNPPDSKICSNCNTPLSGSLLKEALQRSQDHQALLDKIRELENRINELEWERIPKEIREED